MAKVFIIHGTYGGPDENWFPWLKAELEKLGCEVFVPKFPTPENQSLERWRGVFKQYEEVLDEHTIMVGRSLGPAFILDVLERTKAMVKSAFFVSPFISPIGLKEFDPLNFTFYRQFNWQKIRKSCMGFVVLRSDNDPYVPLERAEEVADGVGVSVEVVKGAGHFNASAGYTSFPLLLERIKRGLK